MHHIQPICDDLFWVGASDRRLSLFENMYPLGRGVTYNSYVLLDDKTVLFDTADSSVSGQFFENLDYVLDGRPLDYVIVHHMEPDHAATLEELKCTYPEVKIVTSAKALNLIHQFFDFDTTDEVQIVKEGDVLETGHHTFKFIMAPMVHWPEVMVSYDTTSGILFSADAFGTFGAFSGSIFADEVNFEQEWLPDARRYYANIVGKYGTQVQMLLKKASALDIRMICPLHGPIWRENIAWFVDKYAKWSSYTPEEKSVLIAVGSVYGHTTAAAELLASKLAERGVTNVRLYDTSKTDLSELVGEAFRASHLVLASATYNNGIFTSMETFLTDLAAHALQNRTVAIIENGSWAPVSGKLMREIVDSMKKMTVLEPVVTIRSALKEAQLEQLDQLADAIRASMG